MISTKPLRPEQEQTARAREVFLDQFATDEERREHMRALSLRARDKRRRTTLPDDLAATLADPLVRRALRQLVGVLDEIAGNDK